MRLPSQAARSWSSSYSFQDDLGLELALKMQSSLKMKWQSVAVLSCSTSSYSWKKLPSSSHRNLYTASLFNTSRS